MIKTLQIRLSSGDGICIPAAKPQDSSYPGQDASQEVSIQQVRVENLPTVFHPSSGELRLQPPIYGRDGDGTVFIELLYEDIEAPYEPLSSTIKQLVHACRTAGMDNYAVENIVGSLCKLDYTAAYNAYQSIMRDYSPPAPAPAPSPEFRASFYPEDNATDKEVMQTAIGALLSTGRKLQAIKLFRAATDAPLREAKEWVNSLEDEQRAIANAKAVADAAANAENYGYGPDADEPLYNPNPDKD